MRVIIVDDEQLAIDRLSKLLNTIEAICDIETFTDPKKAIERIINDPPNLLFSDVEMPIITGFNLVQEIKSAGVQCKIVFVTAYDHYAIKAIKEQAFDYLLKPVDIDELKETIERSTANNSIEQQNISALAQQHELSEREIEVLNYMLKGDKSQDIANQLFLSKHTVDTHRRNILKKIGVCNTQELILNISKHT